jgi:pimeloyl-ACP methyl ester carboxylesterase
MGLMPDAASVYFHGIPGSPEELALFGISDGIYAPDRAAFMPELDLAGFFDALARDISERFPDQPIALIGFSLGSRAALEVAARLGARIVSIDLIAPAAPLETGDYLDNMAGKPVFTLARKSPWLFAVMIKLQAMLLRYLPKMLYAQVFSSAQGGDAAMVIEPAFRETALRIMHHTLRDGAANYRREILGYVRPWADLLQRCPQRTRLWHGDADNWAPPEMSLALAARLSDAQIEALVPGLSHYSMLQEFFNRHKMGLERRNMTMPIH